MSEPTPDTLRHQYGEVCTSYHAIDDFRARLLGLLPFASGVGWITLLVSSDTVRDAPVLAAFGWVGLGVTIGLLIFELYGAWRCSRLREVAETLETKLHLTAGMGQFQHTKKIKGTHLFASVVVYGAVAMGWLRLTG